MRCHGKVRSRHGLFSNLTKIKSNFALPLNGKVLKACCSLSPCRSTTCEVANSLPELYRIADMARPTSEVLANDHFSTLLRHCLALKHPITPSHCGSSSEYYSVHDRFTANRTDAASRKRSRRVRHGAHDIRQRSYAIKKYGRTCPLELPRFLQLGSETRTSTLPDSLLPVSSVSDVATNKRFSEETLKMGWARAESEDTSPDVWLPKQVPLARRLPEATCANGVRKVVKYVVVSLATNHKEDVQLSERDPERSDRATPAQLSFVLFKLREEVSRQKYVRDLGATSKQICCYFCLFYVHYLMRIRAV